MPEHSSRRPSPSLVISILALVVAMGGTSYAAVRIGTGDIKDGAVTSAKVRNETIRSNDVRDGALRPRDFRGGLPAGPQGPRGLPGTGRWLLVDAAGNIVAQSGGFEVEAAYPTLDNTAAPGAPSNALRANGNVYIDANEILSNNGITATIALQNQVDQNSDTITSGRAPGADANPEFSGEIAVSQCGLTAGTPSAMTACAPPGTNTNEYFVVSPRLSDGSVTTGGNRKRFYVIITGDSSDFVRPPA